MLAHVVNLQLVEDACMTWFVRISMEEGTVSSQQVCWRDGAKPGLMAAQTM